MKAWMPNKSEGSVRKHILQTFDSAFLLFKLDNFRKLCFQTRWCIVSQLCPNIPSPAPALLLVLARTFVGKGSTLLWFSVYCLMCCKVPSVGPVTEADNIGVKTVTITWKEIPKSQRNGFIRNYTIFYQAEDGKEFCKCACSQVGKPPSPK